MSDAYVLFKVADTTYAVNSGQVQQVEMVETITRVPNAPAFVEGVVYVHGQVIPAINLRSRFHLEKIPYNLRTRMIIIRLGSRPVGMVVDSASEFVSIPPQEIEPLPEGLTGPGVEYLDGVASLQDRLVLVINLERLLEPHEQEKMMQDLADVEPVRKPAGRRAARRPQQE